MSGWHRKGYGRVFVQREEDVERVEGIIRDLDVDEWECYAPRDLVGVFDPAKPRIVYLGKFETSTREIEARCWAAGIPVWCYSHSGSLPFAESFPPDLMGPRRGDS